MKGKDEKQTQLFSYLPIEQRIPENLPLREIRDMTDFIIQRMSKKLNTLYSHTGRPSIPPEQLLRALILQILYSIRSERMLMEQMNYNLLFRWFVGLNPDGPVWNHAVFSKNRDRFLDGNLSKRFFREVIALARNYNMLSEEHFTIDGTLIKSLASLKSFQPKINQKRKIMILAAIRQLIFMEKKDLIKRMNQQQILKLFFTVKIRIKKHVFIIVRAFLWKTEMDSLQIARFLLHPGERKEKMLI